MMPRVAMSKVVIHTLDARDNLLLEVMRDYFQLDSSSMQGEIRAALAQTIEVLNSKGISYPDLKTALVPRTDRREAAFIFDTMRIDGASYGLPIHARLIPLFSKQSNHSVLVGDCIGSNEAQGRLFRILSEGITLARTVEYRHSTQFYAVYVNNLSNAMLASIHDRLTPYLPYAGYADLTYSSPLKLYFSTVLRDCYLLNRSFVIVGHEDDVPNETNVNTPGYPFEEHGYLLRSLQSSLFGLFLSYKIERPVLRGREADMEFGLTSISAQPKPLGQLSVRVEAAKFDYLLNQKGGTIKRSGLLEARQGDLEGLIEAKILSNYIYNLRYDEQHDTPLFDILLEFQPLDSAPGTHPVRLMAALEYTPSEMTLRLVTLY